MPRLFASVFVVCAVAAFGCTDLSEYEGTFQGGVVGSDTDECRGMPNCSFIRRGFADGTQLTLSDFRPPPVGPDPSGKLSVGRVTTSDGTFTETPLLFIVPLEHDELSDYEFPGGSHVRNYIFAVARQDTGPLGGRDAMAFVSLLEDDSIELRIIAGNGDEQQDGFFGLFKLSKD